MKAGKNAQALLLLQRLPSKQMNEAKTAAMLKQAEQLLGVVQGEQASAGSSGHWWNDIRLGGWVAFTAGHDNNINSATASSTINIPLLNYRSLDLVSVSPLLVKHESPFLGFHGGLRAAYAIAPTWEISVLGATSLRFNSAELVYFPHNYLASAGLTKRLGPVSFNVDVKGTQHWLAKYSLLEKQSVSLGTEVQVTDSVTVGAVVEAGKNRYPMFGHLSTGETAWSLTVSDRWSGLALQAGAGSERSSGGIRDLNRDFSGSTLSWSHRFDSVGKLTLGVSSGQSNYTEFSRLFNTNRRDRTQGYFVSLDYPWSKEWHLTPQFVRERNNSNLPLVAFARDQWMLEFRREY